MRHLDDLTHKAAHPLPPSRDERAAAGVWLRLDAHQKAHVTHKAWQRRVSRREYLVLRVRDVRIARERGRSNDAHASRSHRSHHANDFHNLLGY